MAPLMAGQMPVVVVSGGERQMYGQHHRPCPMALTALCHSAAAVSSISSVDPSSCSPLKFLVRPISSTFFPSSSLPSPRVSSVFVSGDAYANPAAVLFLSLKIVVLYFEL